MLLAFLVQVLVAQKLGADEAAAFFYGASALLLLTIIAGLGMEMFLLRTVATAHQKERHLDAKDAFRDCAIIVLLGSAAVLLLGGVLIWTQQITRLGASADPVVIGWVLLALPAQALLYLASEFSRGYQRIGLSQLFRFSFVPFGFLVAWLVFKPDTAATTMGLYAGAAWLSALVALWITGVKPVDVRASSKPGALGRTLVAGFPLYLTALAAGVVNVAPTIAVGRWCLPADVSRFHVSMQLTVLIGVVLHSFNAIVAPKIAHYKAAGQMLQMGQYVKKITMVMSALAIVPVGLILAFPEAILSLFGSEFRSGSGLLQIMAVGQFLNVIAGPVGFLLIMTGYERQMRNTVLVTSIMAVLALAILVPLFGAFGAAFTHAGVLVLNNLVLSILVWRTLKIVVFPLAPSVLAKPIWRQSDH